MQRVPAAQFEPVLKKRLEELWGKPVNLYRALEGWRKSMVSRMLDAMRVELDEDVRDHQPRLP